jgi:hypothetical protein
MWTPKESKEVSNVLVSFLEILGIRTNHCSTLGVRRGKKGLEPLSEGLVRKIRIKKNFPAFFISRLRDNANAVYPADFTHDVKNLARAIIEKARIRHLCK